MSVRITRVAFVYHRVTDIVRARDFYERVLGMKVALDYEGAPGKWWIEYDVDGVAFCITTVGISNGNGGAMPTFEVADIEAAAKALRTAGAMFVEPLTEYPRCRSFTVTDPDGNQIGFHQLKPAEEVPKFVPSLAERWNLTFTHQAAERLLIASGMVTVTSISFHRWASMSPQKVKKA